MTQRAKVDKREQREYRTRKNQVTVLEAHRQAVQIRQVDRDTLNTKTVNNLKAPQVKIHCGTMGTLKYNI
jgi:hypothetical protein